MRTVRQPVVAALPSNPTHEADRQITEGGDEDDRNRLSDRHGGPNDEQGEDRQRRQRAMREEPFGQIVGQQRITGDAGWARRMHTWRRMGVGNHRIGRHRRTPS